MSNTDANNVGANNYSPNNHSPQLPNHINNAGANNVRANNYSPLQFETRDGNAVNVEKIAELFPGVVVEGKVNFELLRSMLGDEVFGDEAYEFTWVGKRAAIAEAGRPIRKTLRPCVEESKNWDTTENLYIEGDNLDVLKLLQESYLGKVKMIYIDPPYNTGNDFIYRDDFAQSREEYDEEAGVYDEDGDRLFRNTETNGRFHSDWCSMIYPRLVLARNMLTPDGVIFISIDDSEVGQLRKICDEVLGEENFIGKFIINSSPSAIDYGHIAKMNDYILFYAKNIHHTITYPLKEEGKEFKYKDNVGGFNIYPLYNGNVAFNPQTRPNLYYPFYLNPNNEIESGFYEIGVEKRDGWIEVYPVVSRKDNIPRVWRWGKPKSEANINNEIIGYKTESGEWRVVQKTRLDEKVIRSLQLDTAISSRRGTADLEGIFDRKIFSFPKAVELMKRLVSVSASESDIILDFFSGSATTAHAVMQLNAEDGGKRKFIMVQLPEICAVGTEAAKAGYKTICEIGKERIRRAGEKINSQFVMRNAQSKQLPLDDNNCALRITNCELDKLDTGFRVLKLDDTNMTDVYYAAGEYTQDMLPMMESNIKPDRTDMDLLYACLLDWGLPLSMPHTHEKIDGFTVHTYNGGDLIACFEERISEKAIREIAERKPLSAVFRDSGFTSSPEKINVFEIFKLLAPNTNVKVI